MGKDPSVFYYSDVEKDLSPGKVSQILKILDGKDREWAKTLLLMTAEWLNHKSTKP